MRRSSLELGVSWELGVHARFLIHDHDDKYGGGSDLVFEGDGMVVIKETDRARCAESPSPG